MPSIWTGPLRAFVDGKNMYIIVYICKRLNALDRWWWLHQIDLWVNIEIMALNSGLFPDFLEVSRAHNSTPMLPLSDHERFGKQLSHAQLCGALNAKNRSVLISRVTNRKGRRGRLRITQACRGSRKTHGKWLTGKSKQSSPNAQDIGNSLTSKEFGATGLKIL